MYYASEENNRVSFQYAFRVLSFIKVDRHVGPKDIKVFIKETF